MSKYLVEVTDLDNNKLKFKELSNNSPSSSFSSPQKKTTPWGILLFATVVTIIISPDLRRNISLDYSPTIKEEQSLPYK